MKKASSSAAPTTLPSPPPSPTNTTAPSCDFDKLFEMKNGTTCTAPWSRVRELLHPAQQAVGYAAVKRKVHKDYKTEKKAQKRMNETGSSLPFVLGPGNVPYMVDSHHTTMALEASGWHAVKVTLKKVCDWSHMTTTDMFFENMKQHNFMNGVGRPAVVVDAVAAADSSSDLNVLPVPVDVTQAIPHKMMDLMDDPWRSFAALVRKVRDEKHCPKDNPMCLRGYLRECSHETGHLTPFFEFRWAYFLNDAYLKGCSNARRSYWDDASDCQKFEKAYKELMTKKNVQLTQQQPGAVSTSILAQDQKAWNAAAKLLIPLCRGKVAQTYKLPDSLGTPMGGQSLPGRVAGKNIAILERDPYCAAPTCPTLPQPLLPAWLMMNRKGGAASSSTCSLQK